MADLVTPEDLRKLTGDASVTDDNTRALETCRLATEAVLDYLELDDLPVDITMRTERRVKRIVLFVAKRNWINPDQLSSEGSVGPLGGDSYSEEMQAGYELTDGEKAALDAADVPGAGQGSRGLFVIRTTVPETVKAPDIYLPAGGEDMIVAGWEDRGAYGL